VKTIVKLIVVALMANALWHVANVYLSFYRFQDAVTSAALQRRSDEDLRDKVVALAASYDVPLNADDITIRHEDQHTVVEGTYKRPIPVLPGYEYPWPFTMSVDVLSIAPPLPGEPARP
jgi:hypothetical protein